MLIKVLFCVLGVRKIRVWRSRDVRFKRGLRKFRKSSKLIIIWKGLFWGMGRLIRNQEKIDRIK